MSIKPDSRSGLIANQAWFAIIFMLLGAVPITVILLLSNQSESNLGPLQRLINAAEDESGMWLPMCSIQLTNDRLWRTLLVIANSTRWIHHRKSGAVVSQSCPKRQWPWTLEICYLAALCVCVFFFCECKRCTWEPHLVQCEILSWQHSVDIQTRSQETAHDTYGTH